MKTKLLATIALVCMVTITACSSSGKVPAHNGNWVRLGEKSVDYGIDHDVINVSYREGAFKQLRFVVRGAALNMYRCTIHFENGSTQDVELRHNFSRGSNSRIVDLKGNERLIDRISFWYDTKNLSRRKAIVTVWGK